MFFKKKNEITLAWLIEVGVPPIYATIIIKRIEELFKKNSSLKEFKPDHFNTLPIWASDRQKLAEKLNKVLNG